MRIDEALAAAASVLLGFMQSVEEAKAMQVETVARLVKARLEKVYRRIDRHGIAHTNLFLAYFELKARARAAAGAELLGIQQSRVSDLVRGKIGRFSIDTLVNLLRKAGRRVEIKVKKRAA